MLKVIINGFILKTLKKVLGPVKFNVINFTKNRSLYENGMKNCVCNLSKKIN